MVHESGVAERSEVCGRGCGERVEGGEEADWPGDDARDEKFVVVDGEAAGGVRVDGEVGEGGGELVGTRSRGPGWERGLGEVEGGRDVGGTGGFEGFEVRLGRVSKWF